MRSAARVQRLLPMVAAIIWAIGCSPAPTIGPGTSAPATSAFDRRGLQVALDVVVDGFDQPLAAVHAGDGSGRLFIVEQGGRVMIVRDGEVVDDAFLEIPERITAGGERGLLGLAFHPRFPDDPRLFVYYTAAADGANTVASFQVSPTDADRADPDSEQVLLAIADPFGNHNGGALAFGPDGFLYVATGDGGSGGDPLGNGQRTDTLLGKVLRIDVDTPNGDRPYGIPIGNPFSGGDGQPEIWLYGLRNPWRLSFDPKTGDLWIGDVGQGAWEEIDVARADAAGGANYGWSEMEGAHCFREGCRQDGLVLPVTEYGHDEGCTVIGGYVYRGTAQPPLAGGYLFADYCSGNLWVIDPAATGVQAPVPVGQHEGSISSFGEDESSELFATDLSSGELLRVLGTPP